MDIQYGPRHRVAEIKSGDGAFEVAGYVSTYGNVDHGGDVVLRGAFDTSLAVKERPVRFLFGHDRNQVLGLPLELRSDDTGLFGRFKISQTQLGRDVHTLLKDGALDSFSIGYIPTDVEYDDAGARLLKSIDLIECSVVAMPMNERATVTAVKKLDLDEDVPFETLLAQVSGHVKIAAEAAEALQARRAADKRELKAAHREAIETFLDQVEAQFERLERVSQPAPVPVDTAAALKLREELDAVLRRGARWLEST